MSAVIQGDKMNKNILIADDSKSFIKLYKDIFARSNEEDIDNFKVRLFQDGKYLLRHFKSEYENGKRIPLCILDYNMPILDGVTTAREIRKIDGDVIVIIVTGNKELSLDKIRENLHQDIYYVKKPFDVNEFYCLVDSLVKGWNKNISIELKSKELEEAYSELKLTQSKMLHREKMASIGQLAAGIAHEINNPLGFIGGNLRTLNKYIYRFTDFIDFQTDFIKSLNEQIDMEKLNSKKRQLKLDYIIDDIKGLLKETIDGVNRISNIVKNLKSFSRLDDVTYKEADINECMEITINIAWNEIKYRATVNKEYGTIPKIKCLAHEINQVFLNLIINASQAIDNYGEINIKTWHEEKYVFISVSDTGCGIAKENLNKIFDPFFTTKDVGKGTGLGLSISYDIIKKHDGEILVESIIGMGTTFTVKLPVL